MMTEIVVLSIVQAITEFLPISSSGHLVLFHEIFPIQGIDTLRFDVALHWGTLLAVVIYFMKDFARLARGWFVSMLHPRRPLTVDGRLAWLLIAGTVPAAIIGLLVEPLLRDTLRTPGVVIVALILGALLLLWADRLQKHERTVEDLTLSDAIIIGASQALAFVPGVSRSGITIITALFRKLKRDAAVRFTFLLSAPIVLAAGVKQLFEVEPGTLSREETTALLIGVLVTAVFGYLVIHYFLRFISRHSFRVFVIYRILLAVAGLFFLYWR